MPDKSKAIIDEMASYLADREGRMAGAEGLSSTDLIQVFALAAVEAVMRVENLDQAYAEELGTMAVMCLVEGLEAKGVHLKFRAAIPTDLNF